MDPVPPHRDTPGCTRNSSDVQTAQDVPGIGCRQALGRKPRGVHIASHQHGVAPCDPDTYCPSLASFRCLMPSLFSFKALRCGVELSGGLGVSDPCTVEEVQEGIGGKNTPVRITICQGKNRQVREAPRYGWTSQQVGKGCHPYEQICCE